MNPFCSCSSPGFCQRHKLQKNEREYQLCSGQADSQDCGKKYWIAWESGKLGATAPANPILNPPDFCHAASGPSGHAKLNRGLGDRVAGVIRRASKGSINPCSGCKRRAAKLNHYFPAHSIPPVLERPSLHPDNNPNPIRHMLFFLWPTQPDLPPGSKYAWEWNVDHLIARRHLFNGERHIAIANDSTCANLEKVKEYLTPLNPTSISVFPNNPRLREVVAFVPLLSLLAPDDSDPEKAVLADPNHITFFCHSKCARHGQPVDVSLDSPTTIFRWTQIQYETCLDYPDLVLRSLSGPYAMTGSFKRYNGFNTPRNHRWHYSGTFYWFRNRDVYQRNWRYIDRKFFGAESWPGLMFKPTETDCLFLDHVDDLYKLNYFNHTIQPAYEKWMQTNKSFIRTPGAQSRISETISSLP